MATVTVNESGQIDLPGAVLEESEIQPGTQLLVVTGEGTITLIDSERLRHHSREPMQQILAQLRRTLARDPDAPFFGGLSFREYAALSEEEERALWERLSAEAHRKVKVVEHEIPPQFRPAGQERR